MYLSYTASTCILDLDNQTSDYYYYYYYYYCYYYYYYFKGAVAGPYR